jgi:hypothetical protein
MNDWRIEQDVMHQVPKIEFFGKEVEWVQKLRGLVCANQMGNPAYEMKHSTEASPFVQGYDEQDGWIKIEFWGDSKSKALEYVDFLRGEMEP